MAVKHVVKLSKKEQELQNSWDKTVQVHTGVRRFAGKYGTANPNVKRTFKPVSLSPSGGGRVIDNSNVKINSVPMGAGGTVPYDPSLEEAKAALAGRTGALYNKGGMQYISDDDMKQMMSGAHRRRN